MIRLSLMCTKCDYEENDIDINNLDNVCPNCHKPGVMYISGMDSEDFIRELSNISENEISKYANIIKMVAQDISMSNL